MPSSARPALALLLLDFMNTLDFEGSRQLAPAAARAARRTAALKRRARAENIPVIYANDNFGDWRAEFGAVIHACEVSWLLDAPEALG